MRFRLSKTTRYIAFILVLVGLMFGLTPLLPGYRGAPAVQTVAACTWSVYYYGPVASTQFYSPQLGGYDYINSEIITYEGNAGSCYQGPRQFLYEVLQWTTYGTSGTFYSAGRAWVCGPYYGSWGSSGTVAWSPQIYYPLACGIQADNSGSWFYDTYGGNYHWAYTTAS